MQDIEKICKNCKYWNKSQFNDIYGHCILSKNRNSMMSSGCGLKTNELFACNQFKPKE